MSTTLIEVEMPIIRKELGLPCGGLFVDQAEAFDTTQQDLITTQLAEGVGLEGEEIRIGCFKVSPAFNGTY